MPEEAICLIGENKIAEEPEMRSLSLAEAPPIVSTGLCSTCNNSSTCVHLSSRGPVLSCELFDDRSFSPVKDKRMVTAGGDRLPAEAPNGFMGLCLNCDGRETCVLAGRNEGVWHCEQYH